MRLVHFRIGAWLAESAPASADGAHAAAIPERRGMTGGEDDITSNLMTGRRWRGRWVCPARRGTAGAAAAKARQ